MGNSLSCYEHYKFLADENVGKLGRWLRVLGYDAAYYALDSDAEIAARALKEGRIILTRDSDFLERKMVESCVLLESIDTCEQLKQVIRELKLNPTEDKIFTRCVECNVTVEPVEKSEIRSKVPTYVYQTQEFFYRCPDCGKIFWHGTHVENVKSKMKPYLLEGGRVAGEVV